MLRSITPPVVGALLLALLLSLGFWQLDRAAEKRALAADFEQAQAETPIVVDSADALAGFSRFDAVEITGRYVGERQALLDAQMHEGRAGYRVWTPLEFADGAWVIVDRGWVRADPDRSVLPEIPVDGEERRVRGFVSPFPEPGIRLGGGVQEADGWPRRLAWPDAAARRDAWGRDVAPVLVLLATGEPDGFVRDWNPVVMPAERHVGYAVQWFALALALVIIALVLYFRRRRI